MSSLQVTERDQELLVFPKIPIEAIKPRSPEECPECGEGDIALQINCPVPWTTERNHLLVLHPPTNAEGQDWLSTYHQLHKAQEEFQVE